MEFMKFLIYLKYFVSTFHNSLILLMFVDKIKKEVNEHVYTAII